ncbi:GNAT family N-acetyltransferase [Microbacterium sp. P04]|uniref:GNAT family N-acetyltransferase n=1 Tax=Microbacterium sp. P04 TaxID=3366947 RepID=UPI003745FD1E
MLASVSLPVDLPVRGGVVTVRHAGPHDLDDIVRLLSDDAISAGRGDAGDPADRELYGRALARIIDDPANEIVVAVDSDERVVGTLQLTVIPGMARRGSTRVLVEAVRVASDQRSRGIGAAMMRWVTESAAPAVGAGLVQLTSDAARVDAHRFYQRLGFSDSHIGFKYRIPD